MSSSRLSIDWRRGSLPLLPTPRGQMSSDTHLPSCVPDSEPHGCPLLKRLFPTGRLQAQGQADRPVLPHGKALLGLRREAVGSRASPAGREW